jgi:hypothetical protein
MKPQYSMEALANALFKTAVTTARNLKMDNFDMMDDMGAAADRLLQGAAKTRALEAYDIAWGAYKVDNTPTNLTVLERAAAALDAFGGGHLFETLHVE